MTTSPTNISRETATLSDVSAWYHNGSLSEADQAWAKEFLESDEQGREELAFDQDIEQELRAEMAEIPANLGWEKLLTKARTKSAAQRQSTQPVQREPSRLATWFDKIFSPTMGMAMAAVIAIQAVAIGLIYPTDATNTVDYRSPAAVQKVPAIRAIFAKSMTEVKMREVLVENNLRIVDGPTPFGEYVLFSGDEDLAQIADKLKSEGVLDHFTLDQIASPSQ